MTDAPSTDAFEWAVHPVLESRAKAVIAIVLPLAAAVLVQLWLRSGFWTGLALLLLFGSEFPFFIRTTYTFDASGVTMKRGGVTIVKKWDQVRSYYPDKNGVQLSPYAKPMWMENFRGLYLQYGGHKDEILKQLEQRLPQPVNQ